MPEAEAAGPVADTYADIRRVVGLANVNLVYRHLAAEPGRLERTWEALRPNLVAADPDLAPRTPRAAGRGAAAPVDAALARATLDAYRRANSLNLVGMCALLDGSPGTGAPAPPRPPAEPAPILPLADLRTLPPPTLAVLEELSELVAGGEEPRLVPTLLRHFAREPELLTLVATAIRSAAETIGPEAALLRERARARARELPHPVPRADAEVRAVAVRFAPAMSAMLVVGELLRAVLRLS